MEAKLLTGAMIVKEFLAQRLAPLKSCLKPLWAYEGVGDAARLHIASLTSKELDVALYNLLGCIPRNIPEAAAPLYSRDDRDEMPEAMPVFDEWGLEAHDHPESPVVLSFGDENGDEDSKKTEDDDLERVSPSLQHQLLVGLDDDDEADRPRPRAPQLPLGRPGRQSMLL